MLAAKNIRTEKLIPLESFLGVVVSDPSFTDRFLVCFCHADGSSEESSGMSSQSSLVDANMPLNTQKFLKFAGESSTLFLNRYMIQ